MTAPQSGYGLAVDVSAALFQAGWSRSAEVASFRAPVLGSYCRFMYADVDAVIADIARAIETELPVRTAEMTDWFVEVIPEFRHDEAVRQLMVASTSSNLVTIVGMLAHAIPIEQITVPGRRRGICPPVRPAQPVTRSAAASVPSR